MSEDRGYKFDSPRYMTKGIQNEIPFEIQLFMWQYIDSLKGNVPLDYLQVFVLEAVKVNDVVVQRIKHSQEEFQAFNKVYEIPFESAVNAKIYVIDDVEYQTMLLADEY